MTDKVKETITIPPEVQAKVNEIVEQTFETMREGVKHFADDMRKFNEHREEIEKRVRHGARRTSGRIV